MANKNATIETLEEPAQEVEPAQAVAVEQVKKESTQQLLMSEIDALEHAVLDLNKQISTLKAQRHEVWLKIDTLTQKVKPVDFSAANTAAYLERLKANAVDEDNRRALLSTLGVK